MKNTIKWTLGSLIRVRRFALDNSGPNFEPANVLGRNFPDAGIIIVILAYYIVPNARLGVLIISSVVKVNCGGNCGEKVVNQS